MNIEMPDGTIVEDVPEGITQRDLLRRYNAFSPESAFITATQPQADIVGRTATPVSPRQNPTTIEQTWEAGRGNLNTPQFHEFKTLPYQYGDKGLRSAAIGTANTAAGLLNFAQSPNMLAMLLNPAVGVASTVASMKPEIPQFISETWKGITQPKGVGQFIETAAPLALLKTAGGRKNVAGRERPPAPYVPDPEPNIPPPRAPLTARQLPPSPGEVERGVGGGIPRPAYNPPIRIEDRVAGMAAEAPVVPVGPYRAQRALPAPPGMPNGPVIVGDAPRIIDVVVQELRNSPDVPEAATRRIVENISSEAARLSARRLPAPPGELGGPVVISPPPNVLYQGIGGQPGQQSLGGPMPRAGRSGFLQADRLANELGLRQPPDAPAPQPLPVPAPVPELKTAPAKPPVEPPKPAPAVEAPVGKGPTYERFQKDATAAIKEGRAAATIGNAAESNPYKKGIASGNPEPNLYRLAADWDSGFASVPPKTSTPTIPPEATAKGGVKGLLKKPNREAGHVILADEEIADLARRLGKNITDITPSEYIVESMRVGAAAAPKQQEQKPLPIKESVSQLGREQRAAVERDMTTRDPYYTFMGGMRDKAAALTDSLGVAGGKLADRTHAAQRTQNADVEGLRPLRDAFAETLKAFPTESERLAAQKKIFTVRDKGINPDEAGFTPQQRAAYDSLKAFYDSYRPRVEEAGIKTLENYIPWKRDLDALVETMTDAHDLQSKGALHKFMIAVSAHAKKRTGVQPTLQDYDLLNTMDGYMNTMPRMIAFKPVLEYFHSGQFVNDIPPMLRSRGVRSAVDYMDRVLHPDKLQGPLAAWIRKVRTDKIYSAMFDWNYPQASQNYIQNEFAYSTMLPEAVKLSEKVRGLGPKFIGDQLASTLEKASKIEATYSEVEMGLNKPSTAIQKAEPFKKSERYAWTTSEAASVIDAAMKDPRYPQVLQLAKGDPLRAINAILRDPKAQGAAATRARVIPGETQGSPFSSMRPKWYDSDAFRYTVGMLKRFRMLQGQALSDAFRSTSGSRSQRAQIIERLGIEEGTPVVERMRQVEMKVNELEYVLKEANRVGQWRHEIPESDVHQALQELGREMKQMDAEVRRIEPLSGKSIAGERSRTMLLKNMAKVSARMFVWNLVLDTIFATMWGDEKQLQNAPKRALKLGLSNALPMAGTGANPSGLVGTPMLPNTDFGAASVVRGVSYMTFPKWMTVGNRLFGDPVGRMTKAAVNAMR